MCLDPRHLSADQGASPAQWQFYGPKTWPGRQPCITARDDGMGVDPRLPFKSMFLPQGRRCSSTSVLPSTGISTFLPPRLRGSLIRAHEPTQRYQNSGKSQDQEKRAGCHGPKAVSPVASCPRPDPQRGDDNKMFFTW